MVSDGERKKKRSQERREGFKQHRKNNKREAISFRSPSPFRIYQIARNSLYTEIISIILTILINYTFSCFAQNHSEKKKNRKKKVFIVLASGSGTLGTGVVKKNKRRGKTSSKGTRRSTRQKNEKKSRLFFVINPWKEKEAPHNIKKS